MIEETISKLEQRLKNAGSLSEQNRQELLNLVGDLKTEVSSLSKTHAEEARRILTYTEASTHEATSEQQDQERLRDAVSDLSSSVDGFEKSHPRLVAIVNRMAETLSNLGI